MGMSTGPEARESPFDVLLVPLDGSALADRALPYAERLASAAHAQLVALRAVRDAGERSEAMLGLQAHAAPVLHLQPAPLLEVESGNPAELIVERARQHRSGLIVMGTHGRSGLGR
jgi:nucleotide-binding universal stress UspA family protein